MSLVSGFKATDLIAFEDLASPRPVRLSLNWQDGANISFRSRGSEGSLLDFDPLSIFEDSLSPGLPLSLRDLSSSHVSYEDPDLSRIPSDAVSYWINGSQVSFKASDSNSSARSTSEASFEFEEPPGQPLTLADLESPEGSITSTLSNSDEWINGGEVSFHRSPDLDIDENAPSISPGLQASVLRLPCEPYPYIHQEGELYLLLKDI